MILYPTTILALALIALPLWYVFDQLTESDAKALLLTLSVLAGLQLLKYV